MPPSLGSTATLEEALRAHESGELFDGPGRVAEAVEEDQEGTDLEEDEGEEPASAVDPDEAGEAGQEEAVEVAPVWTEADKAEADSELQAEEVEPPRQPSKKPALCRFLALRLVFGTATKKYLEKAAAASAPTAQPVPPLTSSEAASSGGGASGSVHPPPPPADALRER